MGARTLKVGRRRADPLSVSPSTITAPVLRMCEHEVSGPPSTSTLLRAGTREAHAAGEAAFALSSRLTSRAAYAELLLNLEGFYGPLEAALAAVPGWYQLTPALDVRARGRAALLGDDLRHLGIVAGERPVAPTPALPSLAHGLGCLYVLEGSALGGRIVARRARHILGDNLPVAFFSSEGRDDLGADWRALQASLDAFGAGRPVEQQAAVTCARATFTALSAWLESSTVPP